MNSERPRDRVDAVVVGGGFYGCVLGLELKRAIGLESVIVLERGARLLGRASYANQARIHNGYHYPRSFTTAFRSRVNFRRFVEQYRNCVDDEFVMLYGIARRNSAVNARQFERFCREIGAPCFTAGNEVRRLFSTRTIESVFQVEEYAFNASKLADRLRDELEGSGITVRTNSEVFEVRRSSSCAVVGVRRGDQIYELEAGAVFNCTYAGLNSVASQCGGIRTGMKFEVAEIALVQVPDELKRYGVTVMDGPFFSIMPFPALGLHSFSHVRYTPHFSWTSEELPELDPYEVLARYERRSRAGLMRNDASRFLPLVAEARSCGSLFEVKVVLAANEVDDGRPILIEHHDDRICSVLGGKLDNVFDVLAALPCLKRETGL